MSTRCCLIRGTLSCGKALLETHEPMSAWRNAPTARSRSRPVFLAVGDALAVLDEEAPDVRVINLETSVTRSADFAAGKAACYRMSPDNLPAVTVARPSGRFHGCAA